MKNELSQNTNCLLLKYLKFEPKQFGLEMSFLYYVFKVFADMLIKNLLCVCLKTWYLHKS